jgi:hypothetical protein
MPRGSLASGPCNTCTHSIYVGPSITSCEVTSRTAVPLGVFWNCSHKDSGSCLPTFAPPPRKMMRCVVRCKLGLNSMLLCVFVMCFFRCHFAHQKQQALYTAQVPGRDGRATYRSRGAGIELKPSVGTLPRPGLAIPTGCPDLRFQNRVAPGQRASSLPVACSGSLADP